MNYIYKITNILNNKVYIGLTTKQRPTDRFSQHRYLARHPEQESKYGTSSYLHRAMRQDGIDNFTFEIIEEVPETNNLFEREKYWIAFYHSYIRDPLNNGYNLTIGGEGTLGFSRTQSLEERKQKSETLKEYYIKHPEARQKRSEQLKEKCSSPEYKKMVSERLKQWHKEHPEAMIGENNPFYGKHHTEESLSKIKEASKKRQLPIAQLNKDTLEIIQTFNGVKEAEKFLQVSHGWISKAAKNNKVAYGYRWKFLEKV